MQAPEFQVEQIVTVTGHGVYVIARHVAGDIAFTVGTNATLEGTPIESWVDQPRALRNDGKPDLEVFAFILKSPDDREQLKVGQRARLSGTISRSHGISDEPHMIASTRWWPVVAISPVIVLAGTLWSFIAIAEFQARTHAALYALFAYTDSAGTGNIYWKPGGEREAFYRVELPFYVTLASIVAIVVAGSHRVWSTFGRAATAAYWIWGLICALIAIVIFGWLWLNVIGLLI